MGRGVSSPHRRSDAHDDLEGVRRVSMDCGYFGEKESEEQVTPVLVIHERRHKMTWAMLVPRKGTELPWIAKRAAKFVGQLCHRCDSEPSLAREIAQARQEGSQTVPWRPPVGEREPSYGIIERAVGLVAGQGRPLKAALEHRIGVRVPPDARMLCWLVEFAAYLMNRCRHRQRRKDTAAKTTRAKGQHTDSGVWRKVLYMPAKPARGGKWEPRIYLGVFVGMLNSSSGAVVVTEQGLAIKTRSANTRRVPESERWDAGRILEMRATPWSPDLQ